jgi:predicted XRE-type DNA-binding protein
LFLRVLINPAHYSFSGIIKWREIWKSRSSGANKIKFEFSSGNVFKDLGLPDADELKIKSGLAIEITRGVKRLGLTQQEAGRKMGISQAKVSGLMRGNFSNLSETKLMECLNRLGYDIEIKLQPAIKRIGRRTLAVA